MYDLCILLVCSRPPTSSPPLLSRAPTPWPPPHNPPADLSSGAVTQLANGHDFYSSPALSPDGTLLAFVAWDHPNMPWDDTRLYLAAVGEDGTLQEPRYGDANVWDVCLCSQRGGTVNPLGKRLGAGLCGRGRGGGSRDHLNMPWDDTRLYLAAVGQDGTLQEPRYGCACYGVLAYVMHVTHYCVATGGSLGVVLELDVGAWGGEEGSYSAGPL